MVGNGRLDEPRDYTVSFVAEAPPRTRTTATPNTLYAGTEGGDRQLVLRVYLSDQGSDGAGWGPWASASGGARPAEHWKERSPTGRRVTGEAAVAAFGRPFGGATAQPFTAAQWEALVSAKDNDPALDPATAPARKTPRWEKYWNIRYSILGSFKTARGAGEDPLCRPDRRRRRPGYPIPLRSALAKVRTGVRDARQDADLPGHLFRRGGPRT